MNQAYYSNLVTSTCQQITICCVHAWKMEWKYIDSSIQWHSQSFEAGRAHPGPLTALIEYLNAVLEYFDLAILKRLLRAVILYS